MVTLTKGFKFHLFTSYLTNAVAIYGTSEGGVVIFGKLTDKINAVGFQDVPENRDLKGYPHWLASNTEE